MLGNSWVSRGELYSTLGMRSLSLGVPISDPLSTGSLLERDSRRYRMRLAALLS